MGQPRVPEAEFIEMFEQFGPTDTAVRLQTTERQVYRRRAGIEARTGQQIPAPDNGGKHRARSNIKHDARQHFRVSDGIVLVGSDAHYWPDIITPAHRAFVRFAKMLKPAAIIMNGDVFDGASVSRHPSIGWEHKPSVIEEIDACTDRLAEIENAAPKAEKFWTLGNHDARFESRLANVAPEYARLHGVHLKDHFPHWQPCWSVWINDDVVVKHRWKGGIHATHGNTVNSGKTMITGHLHSLKVSPWTDYTGTRWGVDTGTLAAPFGEQFVDYTEDNPVNWRSGFAVLTFHEGELLDPELVRVRDDTSVVFRGKVWPIS
jgi:hypothetical protein